MTGTKWGTTPYPELEVFTEYLTHAGPNTTPNIATIQQPTPPRVLISYKSNGKRRAQSPPPTPASTGKKIKYEYGQIKPSLTVSTPATARSTAQVNYGRKQPSIIFDSEIIEISDSESD